MSISVEPPKHRVVRIQTYLRRTRAHPYDWARVERSILSVLVGAGMDKRGESRPMRLDAIYKELRSKWIPSTIDAACRKLADDGRIELLMVQVRTNEASAVRLLPTPA